MNRRHFLGLLPAIPVATKTIGSIEPTPESTDWTCIIETGEPFVMDGRDFYPSKKKIRGYMRKMRRAYKEAEIYLGTN